MGIDEGLRGNELFQMVTELTGLPADRISTELKQALERSGSCPNRMTVEDLRRAVMAYLTEMIAESEANPEAH